MSGQCHTRTKFVTKYVQIRLKNSLRNQLGGKRKTFLLSYPRVDDRRWDGEEREQDAEVDLQLYGYLPITIAPIVRR